MKNNRILIFGSLTAIAFIGLIIVRRTMRHKDNQKKWTIGILQTASHPALDAARTGFMDTMQKALGDDIGFIIRNGEGSISSIHTIAQQFHANSTINGIYAIATPAAQAIISMEHARPIFIAAVTIAPELKTISLTPQTCGLSDIIDVKKEIAAMKSLLPHIKTVGVIFSVSEINAVTVAHMMLQELKQIGLSPLAIGFTSQADMIPAVEGALRTVDALIAPTDNNVASGITLIAGLAHRAQKPLIVSDNLLVKHGALMARGVDYYTSGKETGEIAVAVLRDGKKPYEIPIRPTSSDTLVINKNVAQELGITIPEMTDTITFVTTENKE